MSLKACLVVCTAVRLHFWMVATFARPATRSSGSGHLCFVKAFSAFLPSTLVHFCRMRLASRSVLPPSVAVRCLFFFPLFAPVPCFCPSGLWLPSCPFGVWWGGW